jgi:hypothetical protein
VDAEKRDKIKVGSLITADMLRALEACSTEVEEFECLWPDGVALRLKNLMKAAAEGLDVYWFADEILSNRGRWSERKRFNNEVEKFERKYEIVDDDQSYIVRIFWEFLKKR